MSFRVQEKDLKNKDHNPVMIFFNSISDYEFIEQITRLSEGIGLGYDSAICMFPDSFDEYDKLTMEEFEGVYFETVYESEKIIIDNNTFYYYLDLICKRYIESFPKQKEEVEKILLNTKVMLKI